MHQLCGEREREREGGRERERERERGLCSKPDLLLVNIRAFADFVIGKHDPVSTFHQTSLAQFPPISPPFVLVDYITDTSVVCLKGEGNSMNRSSCVPVASAKGIP